MPMLSSVKANTN